jgi:hypothetical protein
MQEGAGSHGTKAILFFKNAQRAPLTKLQMVGICFVNMTREREIRTLIQHMLVNYALFPFPSFLNILLKNLVDQGE